VSAEYKVTPTWATRELPILLAAYRQVEAGYFGMDQLKRIGEEVGVSPNDLLKGLDALGAATPPFIDWLGAGGWSDERYGGGYVEAVTERTRRELGAWPTPDNVLEQLVAALVAQAGDDQRSEDERSRLRQAADVLGGMARDIAVGVITAQIGQRT
jgi:hypothetical protein